MKPLLYIVLGPTAVGKTKYGIHLAKQKNGEIISADSMQVYRYMNIGTDKPSRGDRAGIAHHLIDIRSPDESWTVVDFVGEASRIAKEIAARGKLPIIVGGTGFYVWSLIQGFTFPRIPEDPAFREKLYKQARGLGSLVLYQRLEQCDPASAAKIHPNDTKRIVRALEVYQRSGQPISEFGKGAPLSEKYDVRITGLTMPRERLYRRIEERIDQQLARGLVDEVRNLVARGYSPSLPAMQALGYKEVVEFVQGSWSEETMVHELKKRTRHFARRQYVWFRRFENVEWIEVES